MMGPDFTEIPPIFTQFSHMSCTPLHHILMLYVYANPMRCIAQEHRDVKRE